MRPSKAQAEVSEVPKPLYFVWFPVHRLFLSSKRLKLGQDASSWLKKRLLEGHLAVKRPPFEAGKLSPGVRQVGTSGTFVLYFTNKNSFRTNGEWNFVMTHGVTDIMPMCSS